jgi:hypothetical protein
MIRIFLAIILVATVAYFTLGPSRSRKQNLVTPIASTGTGWVFQSGKTAPAAFHAEGDAMRIDIAGVDQEAWHIQGFHTDTKLREGAQYQIRFEAKSDHPFVATVQAVSESSDFHNIGLDTKIALTNQWSPYTFTFVAHALDGHSARVPLFLLGSDTGTVWIKNVVVEEV